MFPRRFLLIVALIASFLITGCSRDRNPIQTDNLPDAPSGLTGAAIPDADNLALPDSQYRKIYVEDGYAWMTARWANLKIVDVDPPEDAFYVDDLLGLGASYDVRIRDGMAYILSAEKLAIYEIIAIDDIQLVNNIGLPKGGEGLFLEGDYVFAAKRIIDINPPEAAHVVEEFDFGMFGVIKHQWIEGDYGYFTCGYRGLRIFSLY